MYARLTDPNLAVLPIVLGELQFREIIFYFAPPVCQVCVNHSQYFHNALCEDCPPVRADLSMTISLLVVAIVLICTLWFLHEQRNPKYERCAGRLRRWVHHTKAFARSTGVLCKLKVTANRFEPSNDLIE